MPFAPFEASQVKHPPKVNRPPPLEIHSAGRGQSIRELSLRSTRGTGSRCAPYEFNIGYAQSHKPKLGQPRKTALGRSRHH